MRKSNLTEIKELAAKSREAVWRIAKSYGRDPKIYLHWSAGHYGSFFDSYHINIDFDGSLHIATDNFADVLSHTYKRNSGSIGLTMACCVGGNTANLGSEPPTAKQIEAMAECIQVIADAWWLTIDRDHVLTHGEAADNIDGIYPHEAYGPLSTVERWDLQYLGTNESPKYLRTYDDPATGGNVLRGKALWYHNKKK